MDKNFASYRAELRALRVKYAVETCPKERAKLGSQLEKRKVAGSNVELFFNKVTEAVRQPKAGRKSKPTANEILVRLDLNGPSTAVGEEPLRRCGLFTRMENGESYVQGKEDGRILRPLKTGPALDIAEEYGSDHEELDQDFADPVEDLAGGPALIVMCGKSLSDLKLMLFKYHGHF